MNQISVSDISPYFEGIIVKVPPNTLEYDSELYIYGSQITDKDVVYREIRYNMEDGCINGFSVIPVEFSDVISEEDGFEVYAFDDLRDFCEWYLHKDDKIKKSIKDFKETITNSPLYSSSITDPTESEPLNKLINESKKAYKHKKTVSYFEQKYGFNPYEEQAPEKLGYWEIYKDENCDADLKRIIELKFPRIKDLLEMEQFHKDRTELTAHDASGKTTKREKYKDIIEYVELYVKWALASQRPNITLGELKPLYNAVEKWLEEEI